LSRLVLQNESIENQFSGTVYLKNISFLSWSLQEKFSSVFAELHHFEDEKKLSSALPHVICSSSDDIDQKIATQNFNEKLYYRLASSVVYIPPLRERREDIPDLVEYFLDVFSQETGKQIQSVTQDVLEAFFRHEWKKNIQELSQLLYRIVLLKQSKQIDLSDLPLTVRKHVAPDLDQYYQKCLDSLSQENIESSSPQPPVFQPTSTLSLRQTNQALKSRQVVSTPFFSNNSSQRKPYKNQEPKISSSNGNSAETDLSHLESLEESSELDQFVKKDLDLGPGIDFYRVVEEFENRLIAAALKRTKNNKNRAAQLLSMNRTTLVEKLRKRASRNVKSEAGRIKRSSAFTIFDGLGKKFL
jgi:DNA-binding NtrC family response regulator